MVEQPYRRRMSNARLTNSPHTTSTRSFDEELQLYEMLDLDAEGEVS